MLFALSALLVLSVLWLAYRARIYRKALRYHPSTPSNYNLPVGRPVSIPFTVEESGTLLLELRLKSSPLGWFFDPWLKIRAGNETLEFWFERGIATNRHLVLPALPGVRYEFETKHLRVQPEANLWHYPAPDPGALAIVAPHPDDAEIAAGATYRAQPETTYILNVSQGEKGIAQLVPGMERSAQTSLTMTLRSFDAKTVPLLSGVAPDHIRDLGWPEAEFPLSEARRAELKEEIQRFLAATGAKRVVVPHPLLDGHAVHLDVATATAEAIKALGDPEVKLLASLIHVPGLRAYPIGKLGSGVALPPQAKPVKAFSRLEAYWLTGEDQTFKAFTLDANHDLRGLPAPFFEPLSLFNLVRYRLRERLTGAAAVASADYYRRSIRACELFLVIDPEEIT